MTNGSNALKNSFRKAQTCYDNIQNILSVSFEKNNNMIRNTKHIIYNNKNTCKK